MITIGIAVYNDRDNLGRILARISKWAYSGDIEVIVVAGGHDGTVEVAESYLKDCCNLRVIREVPRQGKPKAISKILSSARGEYIVLTDADVLFSKKSLTTLVAPFQDPRVGATCGRILPLNDRRRVLGFWAHYLCQIAHEGRLRASGSKRMFHLSGYLYAIRRGLVTKVEEDSFAEDALIGCMIRSMNLEMEYVFDAVAYVRFPENIGDFFRQKIRTRAGIMQLHLGRSGLKDLFFEEFLFGLRAGFRFCRSIREFVSFIQLSFCWRLVWIVAFLQAELMRRSFFDIWNLRGKD